jgi:uncharacterized membrane protein HdeD (DUF308 family)
MPVPLSRNWWMFALRGVIAVLFGVLAAAWPGLTLLWLVAFFAAFALLGGAASSFGAFHNRAHDSQWWLALLLGLVSIGAGVIAIVEPALTALVLVLLMGANAIATGVLDIALAIRLRAEMRGVATLWLAGAVSIIFGVLVFLFPGAGALALVWLISFYAILSGLLLLAAAWRVRRHGETTGWHGGMGQAAT